MTEKEIKFAACAKELNDVLNKYGMVLVSGEAVTEGWVGMIDIDGNIEEFKNKTD